MTKLPYNLDFDDIQILKALNNANHKLGQLNGAINLLPNPYVIFNAITLGEAKESSEIENIVTTFDEIFKEMSFSKTNPASGENTRVILYSILSFNSISTEDKLWSVYLHACLKYLKGEHLTNQSLRERFCIEEKNKVIISRLISDAVSKKLIKVFDETTAPRYKSYVPIWA